MFLKMAMVVPLCFCFAAGGTTPDTIMSTDTGGAGTKNGSSYQDSVARKVTARNEWLAHDDDIRSRARILRQEANKLREIADRLESDAARLEERSLRDQALEPDRETLVRQHQLVQEIRRGSDQLERRISAINEAIKAMENDSLEAAQSPDNRKGGKVQQKNKK